MSFAARLRAVSNLGSAASSTAGKRLFPRADPAGQRATGGRFSLCGAVGMPLPLLTTTGRRTGQPHGTLNQRAAPSATAEVGGRCRQVAVRVLEGSERDAAFARLLRVWPPFATYTKRAEQRESELLVFRLTGPTER